MSNKRYIYLLKITIGAKNTSALVKNILPVPEEILVTMAKEIINTNIHKSYKDNKTYRTQTSEQYFQRMIKQSSYEIEDLNEIEVYDMQLQFKENKIINNGTETIKG